jgi:hypothetical protein
MNHFLRLSQLVQDVSPSVSITVGSQSYPSSTIVRQCLRSVRYHSKDTEKFWQSVSRNFVTSRCVFIIFGTFLSGYALLNASRAAANDFDAK